MQDPLNNQKDLMVHLANTILLRKLLKQLYLPLRVTVVARLASHALGHSHAGCRATGCTWRYGR